MRPSMRSVFRRHPIAAFAAALVLLAAGAVALAPWWIDLKPVGENRARRVVGARRHADVPADGPLLVPAPRGRRPLRQGVGARRSGHGSKRARFAVGPAAPSRQGRVHEDRRGGAGPCRGPARADAGDATRLAGGFRLDTGPSFAGNADARRHRGHEPHRAGAAGGRGLTFEGIRVEAALRVAEGRADLTLSRLSMESPALAVEGNLHADTAAPFLSASARGSDLDVADVRGKLLSFLGDDATWRRSSRSSGAAG